MSLLWLPSLLTLTAPLWSIRSELSQRCSTACIAGWPQGHLGLPWVLWINQVTNDSGSNWSNLQIFSNSPSVTFPIQKLPFDMHCPQKDWLFPGLNIFSLPKDPGKHLRQKHKNCYSLWHTDTSSFKRRITFPNRIVVTFELIYLTTRSSPCKRPLTSTVAPCSSESISLWVTAQVTVVSANISNEAKEQVIPPSMSNSTIVSLLHCESQR